MAADVPAFDDIPSFDDLPDAAGPPAQQASGAGQVPRFDDIPSFDDLPDGSNQRPAPEGALASGLREAAHAVIPAAAGLVGAGVGGGLGALTSPVTGPVGPFVGAVGGMVAGSMAADTAQHKVLDTFGFNDDAQRQANAEANPKSSFVGGLAPALATMSPVGIGEKFGAQVIQRGTGAAMMGGFEAGQEYLNEGNVDPTKVAIATAAGAVLPAVNRVGAKIVGAGERLVPGRPGRTANPSADQAHADVDDAQAETAVGDSSLAQPPPGPDGVTTGNPQSAPERSERTYPKDNAQAAPPDDMLTQGDMDPATAGALAEANPAPPEPAAAAPAPVPQPVAAAPNANAGKPRLSLKRPPAEPAQVETGIPQAGEPVAVGENEATPMPPARAMPELKGKTAPNDTVSDAQKAAGNYLKARTHDFGKPLKVETEAGDIRRSPADHPEPWENVSPADYGYFNKTKGADKDHIDFYRPKPDAPEAGDKHFIIDQRDANTGKFDEHKVMTYFKDLDAARETYLKGFSDEKGLARLHDITEVDRPTLSKWLARSAAKAPTEPYGEPMPKEKAVPKVVTRAVEMMREQGLPEDAIAKFNALEAGPKAVEAAKFVNAKGSKTGVVKSAAVTRIRPQAPEVPGAPGVTAKSKADAKRKGDALAQMRKAVADNPPVDGEMRPRLEKMVKDAGNSTDIYKPSVKPPEYLLIRKAKEMLARKTWKREHVAEFEANEKLARSTNPDDHALLRGGNRIEADIARSKRSGEAAINDAENKQARFDVPHEEAEDMVAPVPVKTKADLKELPKKTIDVSKSELAIDTKAISKDAMAKADARKAEAAKLAGKKAESANVPSEEKKAGEVRSIKVADTDELQKIIDASNRAAKKNSGLEPLPAEREPGAPKKRGIVDLVDRFAADEGGAVDVNKIKADIKDALKTTEPSSYIAKDSKEPSADYTRSLSDNLHRIAQEDKAHRVGILQAAKALPKELNNDKALGQIYKAREADSAHVDLPGKQAGKTNIESLPPELKALYDTHLKPVFEQNDQFATNIRTIAPERIGPEVEHHIARITKGDTSEYNMLKDRDDPTGPGYNGMSVNANAAKERAFMALERVSDGKRFVIQNHDNGFTLWDKYKAKRLKDPDFSFEPNAPYKAGPVDYIMRHAMTDEIEANARGGDGKGKPMRYYKNAALSAYMTNAQMGSMARHLAELARITETPEFGKMSTRNAGTAHERGWEESKLPNFKGTYFDPQLRYVLDDYAKPGFDTPDWFRNLNQSVTKLLFWTPTAHMANVGAHWFVGRGWDWITPHGMRSLAVDGAKAVRSVIQQDELQQELRRAGAGTISGGVVTRKFIEKVAKGVGEDIERNPSKWGPIADKLGVPLGKLGGAIYDGSSRVMWAANDMFLTQRILELERKGTSRKQAIIEAERDIPNYRIPTTVLSTGKFGRFVAQMMSDPSVTSFGRYHYGVFNSYANIVKDAVGAKASMGDRLDAVGKMMAMGVLAYGVYPVLDKMARLATGNPDAEENRRGPISIPHHLLRALQGKEDIMGAARSTMTMTPLTSTVLETMANKDFRGKSIVEPGDLRSAAQGNAKAGGRALLQEGEHAARGLVSPYSTFANADKKGVNAAGAVRDQLLDVKNPSAKAVKYERMVPIKTDRDARTRFKQGGSGPLEGLYDRMLGYR